MDWPLKLNAEKKLLMADPGMEGWWFDGEPYG
jgi:hypothetical protein